MKRKPALSKSPTKRTRGPRRIVPLPDRKFYRRREVCEIFGLSDKRLAELVESDPDLPLIRNGRVQIFPKTAFDSWFQVAAVKRVTIPRVARAEGR